jgi:hypothetical protein
MENNRRHFIKKAGTLLAGGIVVPGLLQRFDLNELFNAKKPVGIQLFTVFEKMNENPKETLEQIAKIGYKEIESAFSMREGYYGYKPKEFKAFLKIWV